MLEQKQEIGPVSLSTVELISHLKLLSPDRFSEIEFDETRILQDLQKQIDHPKGTHKQDKLFTSALYIRIAFPNKTLEIGFGGENWDKLETLIQNSSVDHKTGRNNLLKRFLAAKVLFPERFARLNIDEDIWQGLSLLLEDPLRKKDWILYDERAMKLRIIFPERIHAFELQKNWHLALGKLKQLRLNESWVGYLVLAYALKLLAAEEIKITDQGLEVIMQREKPEFKEETPPIPQTRKF